MGEMGDKNVNSSKGNTKMKTVMHYLTKKSRNWAKITQQLLLRTKAMTVKKSEYMG